MKVKNEISEELRSLSTVIDGINRDTPQGAPYVVPIGYFNDFPDLIMRHLRGARLPEKGEASPFQVPEGYFEGLATGIMNRIKKAQSEDIQGSNPQVSVAGEVAEELAQLSPLLSRIDRKTPYLAPEGYFSELVPILAGLQDKPLYEVPQGYFDGLAGEIAAKLKQPASTTVERSISAMERSSPAVIERPAPAKVITMGRNRGWWKYSAAAVVAALVLTIGWLRLQVPRHTGNGGTVDIANSLIKVSDQDIQNYPDSDNINAPLAETVTNSTATLDMDDSDVKSLLGDVPDGELKQYMEEHGGAQDVATN
jgi:hypothetical protein